MGEGICLTFWFRIPSILWPLPMRMGSRNSSSFFSPLVGSMRPLSQANLGKEHISLFQGNSLCLLKLFISHFLFFPALPYHAEVQSFSHSKLQAFREKAWLFCLSFLTFNFLKTSNNPFKNIFLYS